MGIVHRSRLAQIIIDCQTPSLDEAAGFWSHALGLPCTSFEDAPDARYRQLGASDGHPGLLVQAVDHQSRVHLDIEATDVEAEVRRLEKLGARRISAVRHWWIMQAPTGHRFCVMRPRNSAVEDEGNCWDGA